MSIHTVAFDYHVLPPPSLQVGAFAQMRVNVLTTYRIVKTWVVFNGECGIPRQAQGPITTILPRSGGTITGTMYALVDMELAGGVTLFSQAFSFLCGVVFTDIAGTNPIQRWTPVQAAGSPTILVTGPGGASLPSMTVVGPGTGTAPVATSDAPAVSFRAGVGDASIMTSEFNGTAPLADGATFFNAVKFTGNVGSDLAASVYCYGTPGNPTQYGPVLLVGRLGNVLSGVIGGQIVRATGAVTLNTWYRVMVSYSNGVTTLRVNNQVVGTFSAQLSSDIVTSDQRRGLAAWFGGNSSSASDASHTGYNALSDVGDAIYWDRELADVEFAGVDAIMAAIYPSVL